MVVQMKVYGGPDFKADYIAWKLGCWIEELVRPVLVAWFRTVRRFRE